MDILIILGISAMVLFLIFFILLILLLTAPTKKTYNRGKVSADLTKIKDQINADDEEEW